MVGAEAAQLALAVADLALELVDQTQAGVQRAGGGERLRWGVVTDRDVLAAAIDGRFEGSTAGDLAADPPFVVAPGTPLPKRRRPCASAI